MAVPFDHQQLVVLGAAVPVVEGVLQSRASGAAQYSLSATGSLVYVPGGIEEDNQKLVWVTRSGTELPLAAPTHSYTFPRLSPTVDGWLWGSRNGRRKSGCMTSRERR